MVRFFLIFGAACLVLIGVASFTAPSAPARGGAHSHSEGSRASAAADAQFRLALSGVLALRSEMRDPDSFELASVVESVQRGGSSVCYKFRSRNGFGGMDDSRAVLYTGGHMGTEFYIEPQKQFYGAWDVFCAMPSGASVRDMTGVMRIALRQYVAANS